MPGMGDGGLESLDGLSCSASGQNPSCCMVPMTKKRHVGVGSGVGREGRGRGGKGCLTAAAAAEQASTLGLSPASL